MRYPRKDHSPNVNTCPSEGGLSEGESQGMRTPVPKYRERKLPSISPASPFPEIIRSYSRLRSAIELPIEDTLYSKSLSKVFKNTKVVLSF